MRRSPLAALVLLALLGPVGCTGSPQDAPDDPAPTPPPTAPPSVEPPPVPSAPDLPPGDGWTPWFADGSHAFALPWSDCAANAAADPCSRDIAVLSDGTWEVRQVPPMPREGGRLLRDLLVAGPGVARLNLMDSAGRRTCWVTTDAAATWAETACAASPEEAVDGAPEGARLVTSYLGTGGNALHALLPGTGELRVLATQPDGAGTTSGRSGVLPDGTFWLDGTAYADDQPRITVTHDGGRTWEPLAAPPAPDGDDLPGAVQRWLAATEAGGLYLIQIGGDGTSESALLRLHHSADGGRTWETRWTAGDGGGGARPELANGIPIVTPDGRIFLYGDDAIWVSEDGGRTFAVDRPGPPPEWADTVPFGYLLIDRRRPGNYRVSADGFTWRTLVLGRSDG
ncbi:hypothetical protein [Streptomyces sp. NPDC049879]|uniref:hypothetical protein n=1 Tax=Streptomyces sp. NPDC049879 TaxID=3365598 RepID=UPI0037B1FF85